MKKRIELEMPLNRVEGDLDLYVLIEDGVVVDAKSKGTLYRGFENILKNRDALDSLVITPRICGICSITHLNAAVEALEYALKVTPPPQAIRFRNLSLAAESIQSDMRQFFLMYMCDFAQQWYKEQPFFDEATKLYAPFKGIRSKETLKATNNLLKIISIIGGQWPHTSHMVPGGVSTIPTILDLTMAKNYLLEFLQWYEEKVLGMSVEAFSKQIQTSEDFSNYVQKSSSDVARFSRYAQECGLDEIGHSYSNFLSFGTLRDPNEPDRRKIRSGVIIDDKLQPLRIDKITEDTAFSYYKDERSVDEMFQAQTKPDVDKTDAYSWSKAPRYDQKPLQTGPLAQALIDQDVLITSLYETFGDCAYLRELARVLRGVRFLPLMLEDIEAAIQNFSDLSYIEVSHKGVSAKGIGLIEAARGALGHWIVIEDGLIENYQIITPTAWNGSPKDKEGNFGAWEKALISTPIQDVENPVELGHIVRSFDPCLVCTVHTIDTKNRKKQSYRFQAV